jgi:hypothetical protein
VLFLSETTATQNHLPVRGGSVRVQGRSAPQGAHISLHKGPEVLPATAAVPAPWVWRKLMERRLPMITALPHQRHPEQQPSRGLVSSFLSFGKVMSHFAYSYLFLHGHQSNAGLTLPAHWGGCTSSPITGTTWVNRECTRATQCHSPATLMGNQQGELCALAIEFTPTDFFL